MSAPEEIVVTTKSEFLHRMSRALGWHASSKILPGDSITFGGQTIVYRPPTPDLCPVCGEAGPWRRTVHKRIENGVEIHTLCREPRHDMPSAPPPRDEARDAWEKWWKPTRETMFFPGDYDRPMFAAFMAGRASVKP